MKYKIFLPKTKVIEDTGIYMTSNILVTPGTAMTIHLSSVTFVDKFKKKYVWTNPDHNKKTFTSGGNLSIKAQISVPGIKNTNKSEILIEFIDLSEKKTIITRYFQEWNGIWQYGDKQVHSYYGSMDFEEGVVKEKIPAPILVVPPEPYDENPKKHLTEEEILDQTIPELRPYTESLFREMHFVKKQGGHKYKISDGRYLGKYSNTYLYVFQMESVVYIAEDSPVSVILPGNQVVTGTVFLSEELMVMLVLDTDLGEKVNNAYMTVEPWKLLLALGERLSYINVKTSPIAMKLIKEGPNLAYSSPLTDIAKGQHTAVKKVQANPISVIWGPPGTGKTYTMAQIVKQYLGSSKSILIVSHSNISVDVVVKQIVKNLGTPEEKKYLKQGRVLRYGYVRDMELAKEVDATSYTFALKNNPGLLDKIEKLEAEKEKVKEKHGIYSKEYHSVMEKVKALRKEVKTHENYFVNKAQVVATTVSKVIVDPLIVNRYFDVVMFDEASMAYIGQIFAAAAHANQHFVCIGDFNQLAPISIAESEKQTLQRDIFDYLHISKDNGGINNHPWLVLLDTQRRMHPGIAEFSNTKIYHGLLNTHPGVTQQVKPVTALAPAANAPLIYISLDGCYAPAFANDDNSRYNFLSAGIAINTAIQYAKQGRSVGIITPYSAQARLIRTMLSNVLENGMQVQCSTIHQYQGSENEIIIFDTVENYPFTKPGLLLSNNENRNLVRLINVAITRAKGKFIAIGTPAFWKNTNKDPKNMAFQLMEYMLKNGHVISNANHLLTALNFHKSKKISGFYGSKLYHGDLADDIKYCKGEIIISVPNIEIDEHDPALPILAYAKLKGIQIAVFAPNGLKLPDALNKMKVYRKESVRFPMILIDGKILWYGVPDGKGSIGHKSTGIVNVCRLQYRMYGKEVVSAALKMSDLVSNAAATGVRIEGPIFSPIKSKGGPGDSLKEYVKKKHFCPDCKVGYELKISKGGKAYLKCPQCQQMTYLNINSLKHWAELNDIVCAKHNCSLKMGLSAKGIWVKCSEGDHWFTMADISVDL